MELELPLPIPPMPPLPNRQPVDPSNPDNDAALVSTVIISGSYDDEFVCNFHYEDTEVSFTIGSIPGTK